MYAFLLYDSTIHKSADIRYKGPWWCRKSTKHHRDPVMHSPSIPYLLRSFLTTTFHFSLATFHSLQNRKETRQIFSVIAIWFSYHQLWLPSIYNSLPVQYFLSLNSSPQHGQQSPSTLPSTTCALTLLASLPVICPATFAHRVDIVVAFSSHPILALEVVENSEVLHMASTFWTGRVRILAVGYLLQCTIISTYRDVSGKIMMLKGFLWMLVRYLIP